VIGHDHQAPCLKFIARDNLVSDMVGEKLSAKHVEESIRSVEGKLDLHLRFAMLAPLEKDGDASYVFYVQVAEGAVPDFRSVSQLMEAELDRNYYYQHARNLSQLQQLKVFSIDVSQDADVIYRRHWLERGAKPGEIKFNALSLDRTWADEFPGEYTIERY
jgi:fibrillarin-like rRNA methylase